MKDCVFVIEVTVGEQFDGYVVVRVVVLVLQSLEVEDVKLRFCVGLWHRA